MLRRWVSKGNKKLAWSKAPRTDTSYLAITVGRATRAAAPRQPVGLAPAHLADPGKGIL